MINLGMLVALRFFFSGFYMSTGSTRSKGFMSYRGFIMIFLYLRGLEGLRCCSQGVEGAPSVLTWGLGLETQFSYSAIIHNIYLMLQIISTLVQQQMQAIKAPSTNLFSSHYHFIIKITQKFASSLCFNNHFLNTDNLSYKSSSKFSDFQSLSEFLQMAFEFLKIIVIFLMQDRLMQRNIVNHCLKLEYQTFQSMNEDLSFYSLGKYSIYQKIGQGAYGKVYKGLDNKTNREVAIKVINLTEVHRIASQRLKEITLRLIKNQDLLMRICDSPNVVKCYDVYQNESLKVMMLQYCNGGDLQHYIEKKKRISEKQSLLIFKQILNGIAECHSHMIIHRDLKSENIMIHNGQFKIADFGFSKQLKNEYQGKTVCGTITNMAPEVMARRPYGLKVDIWSAGIILFQMICGDFPFGVQDKKAMLCQIEKNSIMKQKRIVFNGYTASIEISDFLRRLLAVEERDRIGWIQLQDHPIFKNLIDQNKIPRYPISNVFFPAPQDYQESAIGNDINFSSVIKKLNVKIYTQDSIKVIEPRTTKDRPLEKSEETLIFEWIRENLVQCLKVELIFQEIILKLDAHKMIDFEERTSIELIYLLVTRCFLTLSPINNKMKQSIEKSKFINQTYGIIAALYIKIHEMFLRYSRKLTAEQDKLLNKLSDFFKSKEELEKADKYFNGIQNKDFNKEEQLRFIQRNYVDPIKNKLKGPQEVREKVRKLLGNYSNINMIQFRHIEQIDFDSYMHKLL